MASIVDPPSDSNTPRSDELQPDDIVLVDLGDNSMIGTALIVGALYVYVADGNGTCRWYRRSAVSEYVEPEDTEEFCPDCFAGMESSEHHEKCVAPLDPDDDCGHHSWAGLMALLGEHWPAEVFPTRYEDDPERGAGPRIISLMRWVDELQAKIQRVESLAADYDDGSEWGTVERPGHVVRDQILQALDGDA